MVRNRFDKKLVWLLLQKINLYENAFALFGNVGNLKVLTATDLVFWCLIALADGSAQIS